jgi:hypothetical protein
MYDVPWLMKQTDFVAVSPAAHAWPLLRRCQYLDYIESMIGEYECIWKEALMA